MSVGLQRKTVEQVAKELDLLVNQVFALLNKAIRQLSNYFDTICKLAIEDKMSLNSNNEKMNEMLDQMAPTLKSLEDDLMDAEEEIRERQQRDKLKLQKEMALGKGLLSNFAVKGNDEDWANAVEKINLNSTKSNIISVKSDK